VFLFENDQFATLQHYEVNYRKVKVNVHLCIVSCREHISKALRKHCPKMFVVRAIATPSISHRVCLAVPPAEVFYTKIESQST